MLKIRLKRVGRKHDPSYRVIVTESTQGPKSGKYIEMLGSYDPRRDVRTLNAERITHWISVGAQPSVTVHNLLVNEKIITGKKINALPKKTPKVSEAPEGAAAPEAAKAAPAAASKEAAPAAEQPKDDVAQAAQVTKEAAEAEEKKEVAAE